MVDSWLDLVVLEMIVVQQSFPGRRGPAVGWPSIEKPGLRRLLITMESVLDSGKRVRTANYSFEERNLLIQLVEKYKHIVSNKKTDAFSNAEKDRIWLKISTEFNAIAPNSVHRDMVSLRKAYGNMQKSVRKEVADERLNIRKTGGGKNKEHKNPLRDLTLQTMNTKTVFGLEHHYDSDAIDNKNNNNNESNVEETTNEENVEVIYIESEDADAVECSGKWTNWTPSKLKEPLNSHLQEKIKEVTTPTLKSRRRPAAVALHSSKVGKLYSKLCEEKLEVSKVEQMVLKNKLEADKTKNALEIQILELELEVKKEQLEKLRG